jgi:HEAT repeat protein
MKKWIVLGVVLVLAGGFFYVKSELDKAGKIAEEEGPVELTDAGIREGLLSDDPKLRMDALAQIEKLPEAERLPALLAALESPSAPTRLTAVAALGRDFAAQEAAVDGLQETARDDPDPDVREAAFNALAKSGDTAILALAVEVLSSTDEPIGMKVRAARLLDRLTGKELSADLAASYGAAEEAADDLSMEWDDWLEQNRERLGWDAATGRFTGGE